MGRRITVAIVLAALTATGLHAQAGEAPPAFIARLRSAVALGNRRAVAAMFRYPLRVNAPALPLPIPLDNAASTLQMYDLLFTPQMRCAIEQAQPPQLGHAQPKYPLLVSGDVVSVGAGLLVAERSGSVFRITRLTIVGAPAPRRAPGSSDARTAIDLRFKGVVRQVAGLLASDQVDRYKVSLTKGAVLQAKLERFRGLDAVLRVTDSTGKAVDAKADGRRTWAGLMPESGDYQVEIVRKAPFCDPPVDYLLTLTVK